MEVSLQAMNGIKLIQRLFRRKLARETERALQSLEVASQRQREEFSRKLATLGAGSAPTVTFGITEDQQDVKLSFDRLAAHGLVLGASGAGKSYFALSIILQMLHNPSSSLPISFGILDAKGELFERATQYLYARLYQLNSSEREALKNRIVLIDFSNTESITPYNILARQQYLADELMVANRIDTMSEQFSGLSELSVRMKLILKYFCLLMAEFDLPLPFFERLCTDPLMLNTLVERSQNHQVKDYFRNRFDDESKSTLLALRQRIDSLLVSEGVRLSLSATSAPDFAKLQDQGSIILINTAGRNITRGISEILQSLILSDIKQSVFRRVNPAQRFIWFFDEAQNLYKTAVNREHMADLVTMARSFASYFILLTQSLTSAIRDQDILNSILANVRWLVMLRSTLRDAELLTPGITLTGTLAKPGHNPFEPAKYMSESEELKTRLKEISKFPDRVAYSWFKAYLGTAVKVTTPKVPAPHEAAGCSAQEFAGFVERQLIGQGVSKAETIKYLAEQEKYLKGFRRLQRGEAVLAEGEQKGRGKAQQNLARLLEEDYRKKTDNG